MRHHHTTVRRLRGFTLIEALVATSVAGVLSSIAYPSFQGSIQKSRRADALVALVQAQTAQERWRFNQRSYGSLAQIGVPATTAGGHYTIEVVAADEDRYTLRARAIGGQARDQACRVLQMTVEGVTASRSSGPDEGVANGTADNRRCWSL